MAGMSKDKQHSWQSTPPMRHKEAGQWSLLKGKRTVDCETVGDVLDALNNWSPFTPVLVAKPWEMFFLPPTCHPEIAVKLVKKYKARVFVGLLMAIATTLAVFISAIISGNLAFLKGAGLFSLVSVSILSDYLISFKSQSTLSERTMFFYWVVTSRSVTRAIIGWFVIIIVLGVLQFLLEVTLGGREQLFHHLGVVHKMVASGEIWRIFIGPFFHSSPTHFLINSIFLLIIGPLAWSLYAYRSFLILAAGSSIGAFCSTLLGTMVANYPYDSYAGISPGIFALFGSVFMSGIIRKDLLPHGVALHIGFIAIISIVSASVYIQHAADASHWAGFVFGVAASICLSVRPINFSWNNPAAIN